MSSIVIGNSLKALFSLINAVVNESLGYPRRQFETVDNAAETRSVDWQERTIRLSSTTALMNGNTSWGCYQGQRSSLLNIFSNNLNNFTVWLILKVE